MNWNSVPFDELVGKVLTEARAGISEVAAGLREPKDDTLIFVTEDGERYTQQHCQECCEVVTIEDICGNLDDLIGVPILLAYEATNKGEAGGDHHTWTFYNLSTVKGSVTIRWYGVSNGYYSESVDFLKEVPAAQ